jgi:hypothetical protein
VSHSSGASRLSRRQSWHKIRELVAFSLLPARTLGGNFLNSANFNIRCNIGF